MKRKKILYLDQFAVSNMYNAVPTSLWGQLRSIIIEKVNNRILSCPMPLEHLYETLGRSNMGEDGNESIILNKTNSATVLSRKQFAGNSQTVLPDNPSTVFYLFNSLSVSPTLVLQRCHTCGFLEQRTEITVIIHSAFESNLTNWNSRHIEQLLGKRYSYLQYKFCCGITRNCFNLTVKLRTRNTEIICQNIIIHLTFLYFLLYSIRNFSFKNRQWC